MRTPAPGRKPHKMSLSTLFARRYLRSRKSHTVINIIARVSCVAAGVPVAAMIILLSVFNGFEGLVKGMYNDFDPDLMVTAAKGKVFDADAVSRERLFAVGGIEEVSHILEDNVLFEYRGKQSVGMARGVDSFYRHVIPMEKMIVAGDYELWFGDMMQAVIGRGIAYSLGISVALPEALHAVAPRRGADFGSLLPLDGYRNAKAFPAGVFALDAESDGKYVVVPIEFTRELLDYDGKASAVLVRTVSGVDENRAREALAKELGPDFEVKTRFQQKASLYKIMSYEKWGIFLIILMVMIIASFSLVGSLAMLIIDKRPDMRTMISMGAGVDMVRSVFLKEGMLISMIGGAAGLAFGLLVCWAQTTFGIIRIPAESFLVNTYPVVVKAADVMIVAVAFIAVNYIIAKFTTVKMIPKSIIRL